MQKQIKTSELVPELVNSIITVDYELDKNNKPIISLVKIKDTVDGKEHSLCDEDPVYQMVEYHITPKAIYKGKFPFTEETFMNQIGYDLVSDDGQYAKYVNKAFTTATFYGNMPRGKRIIYFNRDWDPAYTFVNIKEDGDTRTVFHGGCRDENDFLTILQLVY